MGKLNSGRNHIKRWFILVNDQEVTAQYHESRRHLTRMLQLTSWFLIEEGTPKEDGGACSFTQTAEAVGGSMAYVDSFVGCGVNSAHDCGEKSKSGRFIINICEFYWHNLVQASSRVGTLVHESSHHFGTIDEGYCDQIDCLTLSSRKARNNADTYTKLVANLVADKSLSGGSSSTRQPGGIPQ